MVDLHFPHITGLAMITSELLKSQTFKRSGNEKSTFIKVHVNLMLGSW